MPDDYTIGDLARQDAYSAADVPMPTPRPNLLEQARQEYPVLNNYDIGYKESPGKGQGYMESFPPGEQGSSQNPRPSEFPLNQFGVENYRPDSKASDVMADITSHHLVNVDPTVKQTYQGFAASLQPFQHDILAQQYQHAVQNEGETRPFEQWRDAAGLPGMFRGYAFDQWPKEFTAQAYTPQQKQKLDDMVKYLKGTRSDLSPDETQMQPPQNAVGGLTPEDWMMSGQQPPAATYDYVPPQSWLQKAGDLARRDIANYQQGGVPAMMGQLAADSSGEQDLAGGFGGTTRSVGKAYPLAPRGNWYGDANFESTGGRLTNMTPDEYLAQTKPLKIDEISRENIDNLKQHIQSGGELDPLAIYKSGNQPGVKPEELNTLKLGDLFDQTGAVTKQDLLDHIAANKVQLGEVVKGASDASAAELERVAQERYGTSMSDPLLSEGQRMAIRDEARGGDPTKFSQYTLPGGENYRETLLTLPTQDAAKSARMTELEQKLRNPADYDAPELNSMRQEYKQLADETRDSGTFKSSHFDEPNILAHIRTNDRVIDGKKTLFVEEVQSDWHQKGKRYGYQGAEPASWTSTGSEGVPDAPFKTTWPDLAMKRVIREAAEKGYDKVAWTPGGVQADRYDLSKQVNQLDLTHNRDGVGKLGMTLKDGSRQYVDITSRENLADTVGKDVADKLYKQGAENNGIAVLSGLDLKVGGEGMKGFYDQILPAAVNKIVKKAGGRVGEGDIPPVVSPAMQEKYPRSVAQAGTKVHTIDITPQLREMALKKGFPLFTAGGLVAGGAMGDLAKQDDYQ